VTGNLFFVPTADFLDDLPDPPTTLAAARADAPVAAAAGAYPAASAADRAEAAAPSDTTPASEGSLGIGDLKGTTR
jgi:putative iron-dependent peroxidase